MSARLIGKIFRETFNCSLLKTASTDQRKYLAHFFFIVSHYFFFTITRIILNYLVRELTHTHKINFLINFSILSETATVEIFLRWKIDELTEHLSIYVTFINGIGTSRPRNRSWENENSGEGIQLPCEQNRRIFHITGKSNMGIDFSSSYSHVRGRRDILRSRIRIRLILAYNTWDIDLCIN